MVTYSDDDSFRDVRYDRMVSLGSPSTQAHHYTEVPANEREDQTLGWRRGRMGRGGERPGGMKPAMSVVLTFGQGWVFLFFSCCLQLSHCWGLEVQRRK